MVIAMMEAVVVVVRQAYQSTNSTNNTAGIRGGGRRI
jgi:hypothetical protein